MRFDISSLFVAGWVVAVCGGAGGAAFPIAPILGLTPTSAGAFCGIAILHC